jgi:hypothetical protein
MTTLFPLSPRSFSEKTSPRELPAAKKSEKLSRSGGSPAFAGLCISAPKRKKKIIFFEN